MAALFFAAAAVTSPTSEAADPDNYFYVGTGSQWSGKTAYSNPQAAINDARDWSASNGGAQAYVLVAVGEYVATSSFSLRTGVSVIGGFTGTESGLTPNNSQNGNPANVTNNTVFSGNDSVRVFSNSNIGVTATLQNVVITKGYTTATGGGMYNNNSSPTIMNCTFTGNEAANGGGMYNYGNSNATVTNCTFANNKATTSGGGVYNTGSSNVTVTNCTFTNNEATATGGGVYNTGSSNVAVTNCTFTNNKATSGGGGVYNYADSSATVTNCTFTGNEVTGNTAGFGWGGGMCNSGGSSIVTNCTFTNNKSIVGGGLMVSDPIVSIVTNCTFEGNEATDSGGGIRNNGYGNSTITNCIFNDNKAISGGGIYSNASFVSLITGCTFIGNEAMSLFNGGGGIYCGEGDNSGTVITNCTVINNTAPNYGGIFDGGRGGTKITNCIVVSNTGGEINSSVYTIFRSSVIGDKAYGSTGAMSTITPAPAALDFDDGRLRSSAAYAIKQGDYDQYTTYLAPVIAAINSAYGSSLTLANMCDIDGNKVVGPSNQVDIGALRYIGSGEDGDKFSPPAPPEPVVTAYSKGMPYVSGALTNAPVDISAHMGDISTMTGYPLLPQDYVKDILFAVSTDGIAYAPYTGPINVASDGAYTYYFRNYAAVAGPIVEMDVLIDMTIPTVSSVVPDGASVTLTTNTIGIAFSEAMDTGWAGTVTCDNGLTLAFSGWIDIDTVTYDITSGNLVPNTTYTVSISGFKDLAGNVMDADTSNTFTTVKASPNITLSADPAGGQTYPGDVTLTATLSGAYPSNSGRSVTFDVGGSTFTETTDAGGVATYTVTSPTPGTYDYGVSFASDPYNNSATANGIMGYVISKAVPTLSLTADPSTGQTYPGNVTLTATLSGAQPSNSGQSVTFDVGGSTFTETTDAGGVATHTVTSPTPGTYDYGVSFASDTYNNAATANGIIGYNVGKGTLTAGDFSFSPLIETYDSTSKTVTLSYNVDGIGVITIYYDGLTTAPTDAGTYMITIDVAEPVTGGGNYNAATNLSLGNFTINKAPITVEPDADQNKVYGDGDPPLTYAVTSGTLYGNDAFSGGLGRDPGEKVGFYGITQGDLTAGDNYDMTFMQGVFEILPRPSKDYYITSTADGGASISPEGTVTVSGGKNFTFFFAASSVTVDGNTLSAEEVAVGYYTFGNVNMNHSIDATGTSPRSVVHLYINVGEGGHAEYSVNGSPFTKYTSSVPVTEGSSLVLRAVADSGYAFKEWKEGGTVYNEAELIFSDVTASLDIGLVFVEDDGSGFPLWIAGAVIVLIIIVALAAVVFAGKGKV